MACNCCGKRLNIGMSHKTDPVTGQKYKSCPHCSDANGGEHVFHPYPFNFGKTPARKTARNPDGYQSYCIDCRRLAKGVASNVYRNGRICSGLI
ncbi:hypothetical protein P7M77_23665 [Vibrio parahaemolyticus]|nr:hypothetical protein [Vibrio parahaemolyticus]MDF4795339.1 hypothetical protein [Vibrio parahaemolyticus]MDF5673078.1 hypothetical protein [Vibrio parahaemolyticus]MDG2685629.1 hypothetical protein [Vibrio parahaemolyticus]MDG2733058.1 hypothetical protein [Vibrio parahaemolyticus]